MTITRTFPAEEEAFASLASRVRPLTAKSEPVQHAKIFGAIEGLVGEADVENALRNHLCDLRHVWSEIPANQVQTYSVQSTRNDGIEATNMISDTQLAAAHSNDQRR